MDDHEDIEIKESAVWIMVIRIFAIGWPLVITFDPQSQDRCSNCITTFGMILIILRCIKGESIVACICPYFRISISKLHVLSWNNVNLMTESKYQQDMSFWNKFWKKLATEKKVNTWWSH